MHFVLYLNNKIQFLSLSIFIAIFNDIFANRIMKNIYAIGLIMFCFMLGCKQEDNKQVVDDIMVKDSMLIDKSDLTKLIYIEFLLDKNAAKQISGWLKYNELDEKISEIKNADLSFFKSDKAVVEALVNEMSTTLPEKIQTEDINARVLIVRNMYLKLYETINLNTTTKNELKLAIKDLLEAYANLNFQINKKFERDAQNIIKP